MNVRGFSTGRIRPKRAERGWRRWLPGAWADRTIPVNVFVIEHPAGLLLFDAGLRARAGHDRYLPGLHPFLRLARFEVTRDEEAPEGLRRLGLDPHDVRWVLLSHLHADHAGAARLFPDAELLVSGVEWRRARGLGGRMRGYVAADLAGVVPRLLTFDDPAPEPFGMGDDLLGDGSLL
ncbi:MAG: N-acyl homoserine lactone hydrolase, partial [Gaiellaceae bacterium]|nr:N-acyl homoserine lactone hydrolase [Gaiellaceae bacterium]